MKLGNIGAAVTVGAGAMGWVDVLETAMRLTSLGISIVVGVLTVIWGVRRLRKSE